MATIKTEFAGNTQSNNRLFSVSQVGFHSHIFSLDGVCGFKLMSQSLTLGSQDG